MKLAQIISLTNELTLRCDATINSQVAMDATGLRGLSVRHSKLLDLDLPFFFTVKEKEIGVVCISVGGDGKPSLLWIKISTVGARHQVGTHALQRAWWDGFRRTFAKRHAAPTVNSSQVVYLAEG